MALSRGARNYGARVIENVKVEEILVEDGRAVGVKTGQGSIAAENVVLAGGLWSRDIAAKIGVDLPLYACEHYYVVTEDMDGMTRRPVLRDFDKGVYFKEDTGKILMGWFEHNARGCPMDRIGEDFSFDEFPCDLEHMEEYLMRGMETLPALEQTGIRLFFNGPESFTPDNLHLLGPTPEVDNFFVACGMNSKGLAAGGGIGKVMADWVIDGYPPGDIWECDVRRHHPVQREQAYVEARIPEALGHTYAMHWPFYQYKTARDRIQSPLHQVLKEQGACFGEVAGYERPNWFARARPKPNTNTAINARTGLNFMPKSTGRCGRAWVSTIFPRLANSRFPGRMPRKGAAVDLCRGCWGGARQSRYTQWLNERGGIEADLTVSRTGPDAFHDHHGDWFF